VSVVVCLNGSFVPYERALVHVEDRGMLFADGVYEVVRAYGGRIFALDVHLDRLEQSAAAIRLPLPPRDAIREAMLEAVARLGVPEATVYLQVTRGHPGPRNHALPNRSSPTWFAIARPADPPNPELVARGVDVITVPDRRWHMCHVKSVGLLLNTLARQEALDAGAHEAVFVRDGVVTEGSATNVFAVFDGTLWTHPEGPHILSGVTRATILEVARRLGIPVREEAFLVSRLYGADEAFLSGTNSEVLAIRSVDGRPLGAGRPGPLTARIHAAYLDTVRTG
jgi:D-alanine transaminase